MPSHAVRQALASFVEERDWAAFHTPENLSKSIVIEAGELLECFQWGASASEDRVKEELADVVTYCTLLAMQLGVELDDIVLTKLEKTRGKYPIEKARGTSLRYDQLPD